MGNTLRSKTEEAAEAPAARTANAPAAQPTGNTRILQKGESRRLFKQLSLDTLPQEHRSGCDPLAGLTTPREEGKAEQLPFRNE